MKKHKFRNFYLLDDELIMEVERRKRKTSKLSLSYVVHFEALHVEYWCLYFWIL